MEHSIYKDTVEIVSGIEVINVQLQTVEVVGLQLYKYATIARDLTVDRPDPRRGRSAGPS